MPEGLYSKYVITKKSGKPVDPDAEYFVLRLDTDKHARKAAWAYAESVTEENAILAMDLYGRVLELDRRGKE